jgi:hypothetical protein
MEATAMRLRFKRDGTVATLYDDRLLPVFAALGPRTVTRASYVEPDGEGWGAWIPLEGAQTLKLGPFLTRSEALTAEREYLEARL